MSDAKFTKGPWSAFPDSFGSYYVNCRSIEDDCVTENSPAVCATWGATHSDIKGCEKSDADLITAAPEMYAMLECLEELMESCIGEYCYDKEIHDDVVELLAKARGEV